MQEVTGLGPYYVIVRRDLDVTNAWGLPTGEVVPNDFTRDLNTVMFSTIKGWDSNVALESATQRLASIDLASLEASVSFAR